MNVTILALFGLGAVIIGTLIYALFYNSISNGKKSSQRMKSLQADKSTKKANQVKRVDDKQRRRARENTLKNVEDQRAAGKKAASPSLKMRMTQAGMTMTIKKYFTICIIVFFVTLFITLLIVRLPWYIGIGAAVTVGFGIPYWVVNFKRKRRFNSFTKVFPNAIDVIVRGIRSGLPLNDCLRIIANDADEPVRSEFRKIVEASQMGITVPEACDRLYESVPTPETNFFAIVIAIQSTAGGNLSEALGNLSNVLRERRKMADKVKAFSTEAITSAAIIGSLPFIVGILVALSSPGYIDPLFTEPGGHKVLLFCAGSMMFGIFIMKKMINFKF